jgi:hypothetical protein
MAEENTGQEEGQEADATGSESAQDGQEQTGAAKAAKGKEGAQSAAQGQQRWFEDIEGDDLRGFAGRFPTKADLVKHAREVSARVKDAILPLPENATDEQKAAHRKAVNAVIGVPESPDGYKFPDPPEGRTLTAEEKTSRETWAKRFHDAGVPASAAEAMVAAFREDIEAATAESARQVKAAREKTVADMRKEYGGDYEGHMKAAGNALRRFGGEELADYLDETGLGNDPRLMKAFVKIGMQLGEDGMIGLADGAESKSIQEKIDAIYNEHGGKDTLYTDAVQGQLRDLHIKLHGLAPADGRAA